MTPIGLCLVGCGGMGERHIRAYALLNDLGLSPFRLDAVCDGDIDRAERAAATAELLLGRRPRVHASVHDAMHDDGIKAFDVATDPSSHHAVGIEVLEAGRHLICEKPLALSTRACWDLIHAASNSGVVLATAENLGAPRSRVQGRAIHPGERCNRPNSAYRDRVHWWDRRDHHLPVAAPKEEKGSIALDLAVHHTDLISYLAGGFDHAFGGTFIAHEVRRERAAPELDLESYRVRHQAMPSLVTATGDDSIIATFRMKSGLIAQYTLILAGPSRPPTLTVQGRDGSVALPLDASTGALAVTVGDAALTGEEIQAYVDAVTPASGADSLHRTALSSGTRDAALIAIELLDFGRAIQTRPAPEVDGLQGLVAVAAVLAVSRSAKKPAMPCG